VVADSGNHRLQAFDSLGNFVSAFGEPGDGPGQFARPQGVAVDSLGQVWVVDLGNQRVVVLGFDGQDFTYRASYAPGFGQPFGIAVDDQDRIFIADSVRHRIYVLRSDGLLLKTFDRPDDGSAGIFNKPYSVGIRPDGSLLVADTGNRRVAAITNPCVPQLLYLPVIQQTAAGVQ
jgi:tripartite motif-containing protein 71